MLLHYALVQVLRDKAYAQCAIRFMWVGEGGYPLCRLGERCYYPLADHIIKGMLCLLPVLNTYLPLGMLDRGDGRLVLMV